MKQAVVIVLSLIMLFTVTACGAKKTESGDMHKVVSDPNVIQIGECTAEYKGFEIVEDHNGYDTIMIIWNFTNHGEKAESFIEAFSFRFYQEGIELRQGVVFLEDSYEVADQEQFTYIKPGRTLEIRTTNILRNTESPVEADFESSSGDETDTLEIDITE